MEDMGQIIGQSILSGEGNIDPYYKFLGHRIGIRTGIFIYLNLFFVAVPVPIMHIGAHLNLSIACVLN